MASPYLLASTNKPQYKNSYLDDGSFIPFAIVPFKDGCMPAEVLFHLILDMAYIPVALQHNLPPLLNVAAIRALTAPQTIAYAKGYSLGHIAKAANRRGAIGRAVGCSVAL
jgi:hypothetical protein